MKDKALEIEQAGRIMRQCETGGLRDNVGKARLSWVYSKLEEGVAKVLFQNSDENGGKYPPHNWKKGLPWSETGESCLRHLKMWLQDGLDKDPEDGADLLDKVATNVMMLMYYRDNFKDLDDRFKAGAEPIQLNSYEAETKVTETWVPDGFGGYKLKE